MEYDDNITAHHVLESRQKKAFLETLSGIPPDISVPDAEHIREALRRRLAKACNTGFRKRLTALILEPANPFNAKAPRKFRHEAIVLGTLLLFALFILVFFNLSAVVR
jgi:hypothetical protein